MAENVCDCHLMVMRDLKERSVGSSHGALCPFFEFLSLVELNNELSRGKKHQIAKKKNPCMFSSQFRS